MARIITPPGTFGEHVVSLQLTRTDGRRIRCAPDENADYLAATIGGLGLTGVIESVRLRLRRVPGEWIDVESQSFGSLAEFLALSEQAKDAWEYTVAWIDCGPGGRGEARGVLFCGNHVEAGPPAPRQRDRRVPFELPFSLVSEPSVRAFNALYRHLHRGRRRARQHHRPFFFPLDSVRDWNRIYGRGGFYQYQCVVPEPAQEAATRALLKTVSAQGSASFLAVLKTFGPRGSPGLLSFPMAGTTLALDFPNRDADTLRLFDELDAIVASAGGRLYPRQGRPDVGDDVQEVVPALAGIRRLPGSRHVVADVAPPAGIVT
jgi:FAD/FMN-containing dehydrogenase